ncbi:bidirectional sugar transporter NEC1-like [Primulina eburnea]|uniref:bidirectional sugar transporter NEC1-like n=1 Tax=Primulina eburnea TaxID=1245227 RepID=UPI003C6BE5C3
MAIPSSDQLALGFGLLGNIIGFLVFLAPVPTFYTICKRKSSEGFQSIPYSVALMSASLLLYYAILKTNAILIVSVNCIGCVIESIYLFIYFIYAQKKAKIFTIRLILILNVGVIGLVVAISFFVFKGSNRVSLVGWTCAAVNVAVFAAPLSIMKRVIQTKSVEFMPFTLSFFLTLSATMWFFYGFFVKDYYIAFPNVLGFLLGVLQMILYFIYKKHPKGAPTKSNLKDTSTTQNKEIGVRVMSENNTMNPPRIEMKTTNPPENIELCLKVED